MRDVLEQISAKRQKLAVPWEEVSADEYPRGLDLHPESEHSKWLVQQLLERVDASHRFMNQFKPDWKNIDWKLNAYMPLDAKDEIIKQRDPRKPVNVVIPQMFASLEIFLTYMASVFLQDPIYKLTGVGDKADVVATLLLERLLTRQHIWFKEALKLMTLWRDAFAYGIGVAHPKWTKHRGQRTSEIELDLLMLELLGDIAAGANPGDVLRYASQNEVIFEGNELVNIDPYRLFLDPNTSPNDIQESEFIGWIRRTNAMNILAMEGDEEERRFNGKFARMAASRGLGTSRYWDHQDGRQAPRVGGETGLEGELTSTVDEIHLFIKLIPEEWKLGPEKYPQKWFFTIAGDCIITQAQPLELDHNMFPVAVCAPNTSGHDCVPTSHLETVYGISEAIDWFLKSHVDNVRKSLNDIIVVDPGAVEWEDIKKPGPGKIVRLKRTAFRKGVNLDTYIKQLNVVDVTREHPAHIANLIAMSRDVLGTNDITMGDASNLPERPGARGVEIVNQNSLSRLQLSALKIGWQAMVTLAYQEGYNTCQFMDMKTMASVLGRRPNFLRAELGLPWDQEFVEVSPTDLSLNWQVEPHNGAMPNAENPQTWTTILQTLLGIEGVPQDLLSQVGGGVLGIFLHWARLNGADIAEFLQQGGDQAMQFQVAPDQQVQQMAQEGSIAPMGEQMEFPA